MYIYIYIQEHDYLESQANCVNLFVDEKGDNRTGGREAPQGDALRRGDEKGSWGG